MLGIDSRKLLRAAAQRLDAARILLDHGMNIDSVYLAGYGIECALKALLLASLPESERGNAMFRGSGWHDYERLIKKLQQRGVATPPRLTKAFRQVRTWDTDLRYEVGRGNREDALLFWESARMIWAWVEERTR